MLTLLMQEGCTSFEMVWLDVSYHAREVQATRIINGVVDLKTQLHNSGLVTVPNLEETEILLLNAAKETRWLITCIAASSVNPVQTI